MCGACIMDWFVENFSGINSTTPSMQHQQEAYGALFINAYYHAMHCSPLLSSGGQD